MLENCVDENPIVFLLVSRPENEDGKPRNHVIHCTHQRTLETGEVEGPRPWIGGLCSVVWTTPAYRISPKRFASFRIVPRESFFLEELVFDLGKEDIGSREALEPGRHEGRSHGSGEPRRTDPSGWKGFRKSWRSILQNSSVLGNGVSS